MDNRTKINQVINDIIVGKATNKAVIVEALKQYEPLTHAVKDKKKRPDKVLNEGGEIKVSRIPLAMQKLIVTRAASFLVGRPINLVAPTSSPMDEQLLAMIKQTWEDNKLDFRSKKIAKLMMSETECAEIWYSEDVDADYWGELGAPDGSSLKRMRMKIVHPSAGDTLYPTFDEMANLTAFGRGYFVKGADKKNVEHFDLYTDDFIYYAVKINGQWVLDPEEGTQENAMGKIPVIYYNQDKPEWADVQDAIERLETLISNFADTNDYFASPMIKLTGEVKGFSKKGEQGKVLKLSPGATADYLTWEGAPEAIKLEIEILFDVIYTLSQTPNITFKEMKGMGPISGVALNTFFMDAQMKAKDKQEDTFGECIQRRTNLIRVTCVEINPTLEASKNLRVYNEFGLFKIDNIKEDIDNLVAANGGKAIMSIETSMELNPLVTDTVEEAKRMKAESALTIEDSLIE
jgi:SPP1 family phage portal protein